MVPQNLMMCRESRKLLNDLDILAAKYHITPLVTCHQIYIANQLIQKYYTAPIFNVIKSKIGGLKNVKSNHFDIEHWVSVLDSIYGNNNSVKREQTIVTLIDDFGFGGFQLISKYLLTDFGMQDNETVLKISRTYNEQQISNAISVAKKNNVYNINYVNAILEKEHALSELKRHEYEQLREKADNSNVVLNRQKVEHSIIDMATSQYDWEKAKENAELEKMINNKFGGG